MKMHKHRTLYIYIHICIHKCLYTCLLVCTYTHTHTHQLHCEHNIPKSTKKSTHVFSYDFDHKMPYKLTIPVVHTNEHYACLRFQTKRALRTLALPRTPLLRETHNPLQQSATYCNTLQNFATL